MITRNKFFGIMIFNGEICNDAANFATGYINTDVTGDGVTDASDASIVDNNAAGFVSAITHD